MLRIFALCGFLALLTGCSTSIVNDGTPTLDKYAKRAYNKPYEIKGVWYYPQPVYEYAEEGLASFYGGGDVFHGRTTSTGEVFSMHGMNAAHKTLPLPCVVRVTNLDNGRTLDLKVNDRGPFIGSRIIDLSRKAARVLGFENKGIQKVRVETLVHESLHLARSYDPRRSGPAKAPQAKSGRGASASYNSDLIPVGVFSQREKARKVAQDLSRRLATQAHCTVLKKGGKPSWRVTLGPFKSQAEHQKAVKKLRQFGYGLKL
jgi:rare lipoprotein A